MGVEIITKEDLELFRIRLLDDLKKILAPTQTQKKEWLKSNEVRKLMKISPGTLQNLRITRKLHPSKIGGILYYRYDEIEKLLEGNG
jgi:hypothetical protein